MRIDELKKSYEKFGALYPVLVDQEGDIIDGFHRRKVNPKWNSITINVKDDIERAKIALVSNILRREVSREEIRKRLDKVAELTSWKPKRIAQEIGMSYEWVLKYISQKYKDEVKQKGKKGKKKSDVCHTSQSETETTQTTETITSEEKQELELELRNVWSDESDRGDYGDSNFHGNTPPFILKQLFAKYTKEGDTIVDIMAGSGTSIDVAKEMKRNIKAFDIKPMREDIKKADAIKVKINSTNFVFAHFPYWNMVHYSNDKEDLSNKNYKEFLNKSNKIFLNVYDQLKNGYFVLLIGDKRNSGKLEDLSAQLSIMGEMVGFTLFDKIIWISKGQRSLKRIDSNLTKWRAEKHGFHIQTFDTLLIFKK